MNFLHYQRKSLVVFALFPALAGCTETDSVDVDFDPGASFSTYETFAWEGNDGRSIVGDFSVPSATLEEIEGSITSTLNAKGYELRSDVRSADLAVSFVVGAKSSLHPRVVTGFFAENEDRWQWGRQYFERGEVGVYANRLTYRASTQGELAVVIFDVKQRRPIWRSVGKRVLSAEELSGTRTDIASDVADLMADFPDAEDRP